MDIKQAYRIIPVHPEDKILPGLNWNGSVFVDKTLPFGLRSAPFLFSAVADTLQWMMLQRGASIVEHYIDDFITIGKPNSKECAVNADIMHSICSDTGTPAEVHKLEGLLTFLGIEINMTSMQLRLSEDKLSSLKHLLHLWQVKKACKKQELQSLIGSLSHACKVVRPGRAFIRCLIDLSKLAKNS